MADVASSAVVDTSPDVSQRTDQESQTKTKCDTWQPPPVLRARSVLPDRHTDPTILHNNGLLGREVDPGRMPIYLCLLDERPHLHPSLPALHKHRLTAHGIALPSDPAVDLPIPSGLPVPAAISHVSPRPMPSPSHPPDPEAAVLNIGEGKPGTDGHRREEARAEWLTWRFTEEEEARRKAYLPLS